MGTWLIYKATTGVARRFTDGGFRWGQIGSASLVSLAHGTNDAQKTMGVITVALIAAGDWTDPDNIAVDRRSQPTCRPATSWSDAMFVAVVAVLAVTGGAVYDVLSTSPAIDARRHRAVGNGSHRSG